MEAILLCKDTNKLITYKFDHLTMWLTLGSLWTYEQLLQNVLKDWYRGKTPDDMVFRECSPLPSPTLLLWSVWHKIFVPKRNINVKIIGLKVNQDFFVIYCKETTCKKGMHYITYRLRSLGVLDPDNVSSCSLLPTIRPLEVSSPCWCFVVLISRLYDLRSSFALW